MKYQVVAQWPVDSIDDYENLVQAEEALIEHLSGEHLVDGHDFGSHEANIFCFTNDFSKVFTEMRAILEARGFWRGVRIAYRQVDADRYFVLWPKSLKCFSLAQ